MKPKPQNDSPATKRDAGLSPLHYRALKFPPTSHAKFICVMTSDDETVAYITRLKRRPQYDIRLGDNFGALTKNNGRRLVINEDDRWHDNLPSAKRFLNRLFAEEYNHALTIERRAEIHSILGLPNRDEDAAEAAGAPYDDGETPAGGDCYSPSRQKSKKGKL